VKLDLGISRSIVLTASSVFLTLLLQTLPISIIYFLYSVYISPASIGILAVFFPHMYLAVSLAIGLSRAVSIIIGTIGAMDLERLKRAVNSTVFFSLAVGILVVLFSTAGLLLSPNYFRGLVNDHFGVMPLVCSMIVAAPIFFVFYALFAILAGLQRWIQCLMGLLINCCITALTCFLVIQMFDRDSTFVYSSAGIAVVCGASIGCIYFLVALRDFFLKAGSYYLYPAFSQIDKRYFREIARIGLPGSVQQLLFSAILVLAVTEISVFGDSSVAVFGVAEQVATYVHMPLVSLGVAVSILVARARSDTDFPRVSLINSVSSKISIFLGCSIFAFVGFICVLVEVNDFWAPADRDSFVEGVLIWSIGLVFLGVSGVYSGTMKGLGFVLAPFVSTILCLVVVQAPLLIFSALRGSIYYVWFSFPITYVVLLIIQISLYRQLKKSGAVHKRVNEPLLRG
jgi:Na+-driven multidrug efflux pump